MQKISTQTSFVKPYFIEAIGCEGLSNYDIAKSTNRHVKVINQLVTRSRFKNLCKTNGYQLVTSVTKSKTVGRPAHVFYLSSRAAKAVIATGGWEECFRYLDFLFDCERVATELTPKLFARIEELETENKKLNASQPVPQIPKPKQAIVPIWGSNLWDEPAIIGWRRIDAREASPVDVARGKLHHNRKIADGLARSNEQCQSILDKSLHPGAQNEETEARDNLLYLQSGQNVEQAGFSRSY